MKIKIELTNKDYQYIDTLLSCEKVKYKNNYRFN